MTLREFPQEWPAAFASKIGQSIKVGAALPSISSLQLWLDANAPGTLYEDNGLTTLAADDGDALGGIRDKSANALSGTQGTAANKPTLKLGIRNGCNIARFDGGDNWTLGNPAALRYTGGHTWFAVISHDDIADAVTQRGIYFKVGGAGSRSHDLHLVVNGASSTIVARISADGTALFTATVTVAKATLTTWQILRARYTPSTALQIYRNGVLLVENTTSVPASQFTNNGVDATVGLGFGNFDGDIGELLTYNASLTDGQCQQIEAYLSGKWGIAISA